ncbi:MAG TPA: 1-deoxy-D-xylulose-5-phosphate reductoisomerase [Bacteroidetes bacterium]|nr:1-deoxy-D-xylulose-5-phosphate reductoisomerase [Bacteroidota bacterium]
MQKKLAILGSTGSIGRQTLEVIDRFPSEFKVVLLTARNSAELLAAQTRKYLPSKVYIANPDKREFLSDALKGTPVQVLGSEEEMLEALNEDEVDMVVSSLVGFAGLNPTLHALEAGKTVALANKETMVVAGDLVTRVAREKGAMILPVDSEHSAIFQCLAGEEGKTVEKVILTASGGPFRGRDRKFLAGVSAAEALNHPNWDMGNKITIDCATLMNKGLEAIEARWFFNLDPSQIEVIIHPQSIIHSMVQFHDGSVKAQMGLPDMRLPILYALAYPSRIKSSFPRYSPLDSPILTFEEPDEDTFRNLALAFETMKKGGNAPCVMNAANEIAVEAFLKKQTGFNDIPDIIAYALGKVPFISKPHLNDYTESDREARRYARERIESPFWGRSE